MSSIASGSFEADGSKKIISTSFNASRIVIENETEIAATNIGHGFKYTWNPSLGSSMIAEYHPAADHTSAIDIVSDAITIVNNVVANSSKRIIDITSGTDTTQPVYQTSDTEDLVTNSVVSIYMTDQVSLNSFDFAVTNIVANTSFQLAVPLANATGIIAGSNGFFVVNSTDAETYLGINGGIYNIVNITQAATAVITVSVVHEIKADQKIVVSIQTVFGMVEIDSLSVVVLSVTDFTITIDLDTTLFTAFKFPLYTDTIEYYATVSAFESRDGLGIIDKNNRPIIIDSYESLSVLNPGVLLPAGTTSDVISWIEDTKMKFPMEIVPYHILKVEERERFVP